MTATLLIVVIVIVAVVAILQLLLLLRPPGSAISAEQLALLHGDSERVERTLREEQRAGRIELAQSFQQLRTHLQQQMGMLNTHQRQRIADFAAQLTQVSEHTQRSTEALRGTLDAQLKSLQTDNAAQLEKMRVTVDEKLHATLEARLNQSFTQISERLEAVQRGLGEMQTLATGVGDLKRVLTNVKSRGIFGETQLAALLSETLTPDQYLTNVATLPGSNERVEFAIRLPGTDDLSAVLLPIDAKFPREDFERLLDAQDRADPVGETTARQALRRRVEAEAASIRDKYLAPPHTTDFAVLFLATESLYAEVLRQPGLFETVQAKYQVTLAGPTTLAALLNSLRMGFRTLAIEKRSSEVWQILGAVKAEFGKFATVLERTRKQLDTARNTIDNAGVRTRAIERTLRGVEALPVPEARAVLGPGGFEGDPEGNLEDDPDGDPAECPAVAGELTTDRS